jgi:F0F1-type ATP synthase assembly protein I
MASTGNDWRESLREAGPYLHLGWQFLGVIVVFAGGGYWLDSRLGTLPGLTILGVALSMGVILLLVLKVDAEARTRKKRRERKSDDA